MARTINEILAEAKKYLTKEDYEIIRKKVAYEREETEKLYVSEQEKVNRVATYEKCYTVYRAGENIYDKFEKIEEEDLPRLEREYAMSKNRQQSAKKAVEIQKMKQTRDFLKSLYKEMYEAYDILTKQNEDQVNKMIKKSEEEEAKRLSGDQKPEGPRR